MAVVPSWPRGRPAPFTQERRWSQWRGEDQHTQVLQKNMGLFSLRSQLAQEGNSSEEDSTRKRSSESVGGTEWPSRSEVTFPQMGHDSLPSKLRPLRQLAQNVW